MDVAVRELKAKLSSYLKQAAAGETIMVTDRGRPVAVLGPVPQRVDLAGAVAVGWVTPATASGRRPSRRHRGAGSTLDVLADDRTS